MRMKLQLSIIGILLSINAFADGYYPAPTSLDQPWSVTASVGRGKYPQNPSYYRENNPASARLAVENELLLTGDIALGLELGLQSGSHFHLQIPFETLKVLDWLPVQTTLNPMLDLLITAKSDPLWGSAFFAQLKGGVIYRKWRIQQASINDLTQLAGEIQAGFGYPITALASLNLLYQGVFGNEPQLFVDTSNKTAHISNIPSLHGVLLGFSVNL